MITSLPPSYGSTPIAHTLTKTREIGGREAGKMRDGQVFGEQHSEWLERVDTDCPKVFGKARDSEWRSAESKSLAGHYG